MQSAGIGIGWLWILGLSLLALLGLFLLWRGLRPRREGTTPYCRKCRYNLTGTDRTADGARCSECGSPITLDGAVVFGERVRRWRRVFAGSVVFLLGAAPLALIGIGAARAVDWYTYEPTRLVLEDLAGANVRTRYKALAEIKRRLRNNDLSGASKSRLIEICLSEQEAPWLPATRSPTLPPPGPVVIELMKDLYDQSALSQSQEQRFFANMQRFSLAVRPRVVRGHVFAVELRHDWRAPARLFWVGIRRSVLCLDGRQVAAPRRLGYICGSPWAHAEKLDVVEVAAAESGVHRLSTEVSVTVYVGDRDTFRDNPPVFEATVSVETSVEVLDEEPAGYVELNSSPELDAVVTQCLAVRNVRLEVARAPGRGSLLLGELHVLTGAPVDLALELLAQVDGREVRLDEVILRDSGSSAISGRAIHAFSAALDEPNPQHIVFIVRGSKKLALKTTDLVEIWGGELRFENVEVTPGDASQWPRSEGRYVPTIAPRTPAPSDREPAQP